MKIKKTLFLKKMSDFVPTKRKRVEGSITLAIQQRDLNLLFRTKQKGYLTPKKVIDIACETRDFTILDMYNQLPDAHKSIKDSPMEIAYEKKRFDIVDYLIERKSNPGFLLHSATTSGDFETVKKLVENGASVNQKLWVTPISIAIESSNLKMTQFFIENGAEIVDVMLWKPTARNETDLVEMLVKSGANPIKIDEECNHNAFYQINTIEMANLYEKLGFDIRSDCGKGMNLLHVASLTENPDFVKYLISIGFDPRKESDEKKTPLRYASLFNNHQIVEELLRFGFDEREAKSLWKHLKEGNSATCSLLLEKKVPLPSKFKRDWFKPLFLRFGEQKVRSLLFLAREKSPESLFFKDYLCFDLFKLIFQVTIETLRNQKEIEWNQME